MSIYPVIMCGGSGTRLWPASRPGRPKQFIPLTGEQSSFQTTVTRVLGIPGALSPVIIAGVKHRAMIEAQLAELGARAVIILEPAARDSAAAMAAAAAWIADQDPDGVAVFVSADHEIADHGAFQEAALVAVDSARAGRIVTLGVRPRHPSTAFGYIRPDVGAGPVHPVAAFVEKPPADLAKTYVAEGYLWNSGNFVTAASVLMEELRRHAADVAEMASQAVRSATRDGDVLTLGDIFCETPRISIDYAVMEKTRCASVLPVSFDWADIGAWDAVLSTVAKDARGNSAPSHALLINTDGSLIRAPHTMQVAIVGARDLAVIVEDDAVLICDLSQSQSVKTAGDKFSAARGADRFATLSDARAWYRQWLWTRALPLWWTLGADHGRGGYREALAADGAAVEPQRRARVPARQTYTFAASGAAGWPGPWRDAARHGLAALNADYRRADGLYRTLAKPTGEIIDDTAYLYDQAFVLLALAAMQGAGEGETETQALALLTAIEVFRADAGFREAGARPYQSNCQMHLLEAALAWAKIGASPAWKALADELVTLAADRLLDRKGGFIPEAFDDRWRSLAEETGLRVEPGHQFEWAWLLTRYAQMSSRTDLQPIARSLFQAGLKGVDPARGVAMNAVDAQGDIIDGKARLWPQAEYLRAALVLGEDDHALTAANGLVRYLDSPAPGLWRDEMGVSGDFSDQPSPTSTLYHLYGACEALGL